MVYWQLSMENEDIAVANPSSSSSLSMDSKPLGTPQSRVLLGRILIGAGNLPYDGGERERQVYPRWASLAHLNYCATERPDIGGEALFHALQCLTSHPKWRPFEIGGRRRTGGSTRIHFCGQLQQHGIIVDIVRRQLPRQTKIGNLHRLGGRADQNVLRFYVAVDDLLRMEVRQALHNISGEPPYLWTNK